MSTYKKEIKLGQPIDVVSMVMEDYVFHNQFKRSDWEGEMVFAAGDGNPGTKYLKWTYAGGVLYLEAWVKGPGDRALDLKGVLYSGIRATYHASLVKLEKEVAEHCAHVKTGHIGADPLKHDHHKDASEEAKYKNSVGYDYSHKKDSNQPTLMRGMLFAILAIFLSGVPFVGILFASLAMGRVNHQPKSQLKTTIKSIALIAFFTNIYTILIFIGLDGKVRQVVVQLFETFMQ